MMAFKKCFLAAATAALGTEILNSCANFIAKSARYPLNINQIRQVWPEKLGPTHANMPLKFLKWHTTKLGIGS